VPAGGRAAPVAAEAAVLAASLDTSDCRRWRQQPPFPGDGSGASPRLPASPGSEHRSGPGKKMAHE
jgi:hypothetical protein